jgi:hypothetical protein
MENLSNFIFNLILMTIRKDPNNYNFSAKYERKTSSCPITRACPITKPKVYVPPNKLKLQSYSINSILARPIFSKFQLWSQISQ